MPKQENNINCPLCGETVRPFASDRNREYKQCSRCALVFAPERYHLPPNEEKERYDFHQNNPEDPRYRKFLSRLFHPLESKLNPGACGLDFGCGPGPALSRMFEEAGYPCAIYDLHYANHPEVLEKQYDFLSCSETIEHMYRPREEFKRFLTLLKPGGWIGIMTQLFDEAPVGFGKWHYKDDDTHVCFFSKTSFQWLAEQYELTAEFHPRGVVLFRTAE